MMTDIDELQWYQYQSQHADEMERVTAADREIDGLHEALGEMYLQLDTLREAVKPLYRTEWPHRVYEILASRNYALAERFATVMHDLHEAMEPLATDDPASDNGDTVEAEQGVLW